eukprot:364779-Chlamydomonas_euryale.AAC.1
MQAVPLTVVQRLQNTVRMSVTCGVKGRHREGQRKGGRGAEDAGAGGCPRAGSPVGVCSERRRERRRERGRERRREGSPRAGRRERAQRACCHARAAVRRMPMDTHCTCSLCVPAQRFPPSVRHTPRNASTLRLSPPTPPPSPSPPFPPLTLPAAHPRSQLDSRGGKGGGRATAHLPPKLEPHPLRQGSSVDPVCIMPGDEQPHSSLLQGSSVDPVSVIPGDEQPRFSLLPRSSAAGVELSRRITLPRHITLLCRPTPLRYRCRASSAAVGSSTARGKACGAATRPAAAPPHPRWMRSLAALRWRA